MFDFNGANDGYYTDSYGLVVDALKADGKSLYSADLFTIWFYLDYTLYGFFIKIN
jgi:hypothetical protein